MDTTQYSPHDYLEALIYRRDYVEIWKLHEE